MPTRDHAWPCMVTRGHACSRVPMHESCMSRPLSSAHHIHGHYMTQSTWSSTVVTLMDHTWSPLVWPFMATDSCFVPSLFTNHFYQKPTFNGFARLCVSGSPVSLIWLPCLMSARRPARKYSMCHHSCRRCACSHVSVQPALFFRTHRPDLIVMEQQSRSTCAHSLRFLSFGLANSHGQCHLRLPIKIRHNQAHDWGHEAKRDCEDLAEVHDNARGKNVRKGIYALGGQAPGCTAR